MGVRLRSMRFGLGLLAGAGALLAQAALAGETKGYVVSWFQPAMYSGADDCPHGMQPPIDFAALFQSQGRSPAEVKELLDHPLTVPFIKALLFRGPHGEDVCSKPESVPDPGLVTAEGRVAFGLDLDGAADADHPAPGTCAHQPFEGPDGRKGVDNQLYRVLGCLSGHRGTRGNDGFVFQYIMERMRSEGLLTYAVELTGVDDMVNDDDVTVGVYQGSDPLIQNAKGEVQADMTQRLAADPRWMNRVKGRIKDGVLTTDVFDLNLLGAGLWIPEFHFKHARMELTLQPDGGFKGIVAGYLDILPLYFNSAKSTYGFEINSSGNCPGVWYAYNRMADGYPDPKTGRCTALSSAWAIEAVPAFIIHPPARTASGSAPATPAPRAN
jgi:hypothetical protein